MYKGKFDQKAKGEATDVQELLAQRSAAAAKQKESPAVKKPASPKGQAAKTAPNRMPSMQSTPSRDAAPKAQGRKPASQPAPQKKKGPRLGGVIFYTLYFMFILVFFIATYIGMRWLNGWLQDYEAAQPTVKAEQVFTQLFTNPDWSSLYEVSGAQDSPYEGKEEFVTYMSSKVDASQLTYLQTSAGLAKDTMKYEVRMGSEKIATFTLVDKNPSEEKAKIPDWQLGTVDIFFEREGTYRIEKLDGHTAYVNDVALDDSFTIQKATTLAETYLPTGTTGVVKCTQEITGLMAKPTVTIFDKDGNQVEVYYNEDTRTFTESSDAAATIGVEEKTAALGAAESYCKWMIEELTDRGVLASYYDPTSQIYKDISSLTHYDLWAQDNNGFELLDEEVTNYVRYSDSLFSVRVTLTMKINVRVDGSTKTFDYDQSLFFRKTDSGKWLCYESTNVDVSQPVGKVRLTFMQGDTLLVSDFYQTDAKEIITPLITPIPEGKVFSGWVRQDEDESGNTTLTVVFQPDETGKVTISEGTSLTPMTLYALFEDEGAASTAVPETTAPAATEGA